MHCDDLAIYHDIDRPIEMEINSPNLANFSKGMPRVRAVIECAQVAY